MSTATVIAIFAAFVLIAVIAWMYENRRRSHLLHHHFGPEYDRLVHERGSRRRAEHELADRAKRVKGLTIRPLLAGERAHYAELWRAQQIRFVDDPRGAVSEADRLVEEVMRLRGYPVGDFEQRAADVSVDHPRVVENYRLAHDIALRHERGQASTEELRKAMIYYRALFEDLLEDQPVTVEMHSR